jgi:hypothetical protein
LLLVLAGLTASVATGCAQHGDRAAKASENAANGEAATSNGAATAPSASEVTPATLTVADIDLYERMARDRIDSMKALSVRLSQAKTSGDTIQAMRGLSTAGADSAAARAAGVSPMHLHDVAKVIEDAIAKEDDAARLADVGSQVDTTNMSPEDLAKTRQLISQARGTSDSIGAKATAGMSPTVAAALKQRRPLIDSLEMQLMRQAPGGGGH